MRLVLIELWIVILRLIELRIVILRLIELLLVVCWMHGWIMILVLIRRVLILRIVIIGTASIEVIRIHGISLIMRVLVVSRPAKHSGFFVVCLILLSPLDCAQKPALECRFLGFGKFLVEFVL